MHAIVACCFSSSSMLHSSASWSLKSNSLRRALLERTSGDSNLQSVCVCGPSWSSLCVVSLLLRFPGGHGIPTHISEGSKRWGKPVGGYCVWRFWVLVSSFRSHLITISIMFDDFIHLRETDCVRDKTVGSGHITPTFISFAIYSKTCFPF